MRYGLIVDGVVVNVVEAALPPQGWVEVAASVGPGHTVSGGDYTAPAARRRLYTLSQWIDAMTAAELDVILDYVNGDAGTANQKRAARRVWECWRAQDRVDFNVAKNQQVLTWFVNNSGGVWTSQRAAELIG